MKLKPLYLSLVAVALFVGMVCAVRAESPPATRQIPRMAVPGKFRHPGLLNTLEELQAVKKKIASGEEPWKSAFEQMKSSRYAGLKYKPRPHETISSGFLGAGALPAADAATLDVPRHKPCNLFEAGAAVGFEAAVSSQRAGDLEINVAVTRDDGQAVFNKKQALTLQPRAKHPFPLDLGKFEPGYYEMKLTTGDGMARTMSFGVVPFVGRTAEQARGDGKPD